MNIIEELYFGKIDPNTQSFDESSRFNKTMSIIETNENKLMELLEGKEKQLFIEIMNAQSEINGTTAVEKFIKGFKIGARIGLEVLNEDDSCLRDIT